MTRTAGIRPRRAALRILAQVRDGKPFDAALDRSIIPLKSEDRRLAHELAAGVLRRRTTLDQQLAPLVPRGWESVVPQLQDVLRLGAYQLTELQRVPAHAAVDTSVALAKDLGGSRAGAFVNAVLRRLSRTQPSPSPRSQSVAGALAEEYSHPEWLILRWLNSFGSEGTVRLLRWNNTRPRLVLQAARKPLDQLAEHWSAQGMEIEPAPYGAGLLTDRSRPAELPGYKEGDFIVQDPAQALLARFAGVQAQEVVYDACAAPGGKSIALGRSVGRVIAGEVSRLRARRLADNLDRAGSGREHVVVADARQPPVQPVHVVLVDAPCLGTGTFARHPDARWRVTPAALDKLVRLQAEILTSAAQVVRPGGLLIYSTCSLEPEENQQQVERFLLEHPEFRREPAEGFPEPLISSKGDLMILPQHHDMDGAYAARLRRSA